MTDKPEPVKLWVIFRPDGTPSYVELDYGDGCPPTNDGYGPDYYVVHGVFVPEVEP